MSHDDSHDRRGDRGLLRSRDCLLSSPLNTRTIPVRRLLISAERLFCSWYPSACAICASIARVTSRGKSSIKKSSNVLALTPKATKGFFPSRKMDAIRRRLRLVRQGTSFSSVQPAAASAFFAKRIKMASGSFLSTRKSTRALSSYHAGNTSCLSDATFIFIATHCMNPSFFCKICAIVPLILLYQRITKPYAPSHYQCR